MFVDNIFFTRPYLKSYEFEKIGVKEIFVKCTRKTFLKICKPITLSTTEPSTIFPVNFENFSTAAFAEQL